MKILGIFFVNIYFVCLFFFFEQATVLQQLSDAPKGPSIVRTLRYFQQTTVVQNRAAEIESQGFDILSAIEAHFDDWMCR